MKVITRGRRGALMALALLTIVGIADYLLNLGVLHFLRPDVNPVTEPISTYATGPYGFLLTAVDSGAAVAALALTLGLSIWALRRSLGPTSAFFPWPLRRL